MRSATTTTARHARELLSAPAANSRRPPRCGGSQRARVATQGHPMKPHRMRMTHDLLTKYDVLNQMEVPFRAPRARGTRSAFRRCTRLPQRAQLGAARCSLPRSAARDGVISRAVGFRGSLFSRVRCRGAACASWLRLRPGGRRLRRLRPFSRALEASGLGDAACALVALAFCSCADSCLRPCRCFSRRRCRPRR